MCSVPVGFEGGTWDLIVFTPDHSLSTYFVQNLYRNKTFVYYFANIKSCIEDFHFVRYI